MLKQMPLAKTIQVSGRKLILRPESGTFLKGAMLIGLKEDRNITLVVRKVLPQTIECQLLDAPSHWARPGMSFEPYHYKS